MRRLQALLLALAASAAPLSAQGPGAMAIRVVDDSTGMPVGRAEILLDVGRLLHTDGAGQLRMPDLSPGEWTLKAMRVGYRPQFVVVRVPSGGEVQVEIALRPQAVHLTGIPAIGKRLDRRLARTRFYERRGHGPTVSWDGASCDGPRRMETCRRSSDGSPSSAWSAPTPAGRWSPAAGSWGSPANAWSPSSWTAAAWSPRG